VGQETQTRLQTSLVHTAHNISVSTALGQQHPQPVPKEDIDSYS